MREAWLAVVLVFTSWAGCIGDAGKAPIDPTSSERDGTPVNGSVFTVETVNLSTDCGDCFEPSVATDDQRRVYVVSQPSEEIFVRDLETGNATTVPEPPLPDTVPPGTAIGDDTVQVGPEGRLYFTALLCNRLCGSSGIQVARSDDGGQTWSVNTAVNLAGQPGAPTVNVDRQWLGFGEGDRVYLAYSQYAPRTGVWTAVSTDAGASWGEFVRAHPVEEDKPFGSPGHPVSPIEDTVVLPGRGSTTVHVDVSTDGGRSYEHVSVHDLEEGFVDQWAQATVDESSRVHLAWTTSAGQVQVTHAEGDLETWATPANWTGQGASALLPPMIRVHDDTAMLAWYESTGETGEVHIAQAPANATLQGPTAHRVLDPRISATGSGSPLSSGSPVHTDFMHADVGPNGTLAVAYSTGSELVLGLAE